MAPLKQFGKCSILQDEEAVSKLERKHFDPDYWQDRLNLAPVFGGRGGSIRISIDGQEAILRQYLRGGRAVHLSTDRYLWLGKSRTRAWREWSMLRLALEAGFPVPSPLGVCVCRDGILYRAAIITAYIRNTETLAQRISHSALGDKSWRQLGLLLKRLQGKYFRHADLNANNILIDQQDRFYLIDFDRARLMKNLGDWQWSALRRLQRSLKKIGRQQKIHYQPTDWQALIEAYQTA